MVALSKWLIFVLGLGLGGGIVSLILDCWPNQSFPEFMMIERKGEEILWAETREWQYAFTKGGAAYIAFPLYKPQGSKNPFETKSGNNNLSR